MKTQLWLNLLSANASGAFKPEVYPRLKNETNPRKSDKGAAVRSLKPQDDVRDVSEPVQAATSTLNSATEEVGKIRKICEQENEAIRQQVKRVADHVSALA